LTLIQPKGVGYDDTAGTYNKLWNLLNNSLKEGIFDVENKNKSWALLWI
jgi:hypothetical protein